MLINPDVITHLTAMRASDKEDAIAIKYNLPWLIEQLGAVETANQLGSVITTLTSHMDEDEWTQWMNLLHEVNRLSKE